MRQICRQSYEIGLCRRGPMGALRFWRLIQISSAFFHYTFFSFQQIVNTLYKFGQISNSNS